MAPGGCCRSPFVGVSIAGRLLRGTARQGYFDAYLQYPISSPAASLQLDFRMAPGLRDRLKLDLRYIRPDGAVRAYEIAADSEPMALNPH